MEHFGHSHSLILNEEYNAGAGDVCYLCNEQIVSCKSFVYSCKYKATGTSDCDRFLLHKSCAELPQKITHPTKPGYYLHLVIRSDPYFMMNCDICKIVLRSFRYVGYPQGRGFYVPKGLITATCIKCATYHVQSLEDRSFKHSAHNQHQLILVQRPSSFKCDACTITSADRSYICTMCPFWIHYTCAHAPTSIKFIFHKKHHLLLAYSLPQVYHKFSQFCRLCRETVILTQWLYYCPSCRFFVHFKCAISTTTSSSEIDEVEDSNLLHLPATDKLSADLLSEQLVKAIIENDDNDSVIELKRNNPWVKHEHDLQLLSTNELEPKDGKQLICDGCVKPIRREGDPVYGCLLCNYFLHNFCARLSHEFMHRLWPNFPTISICQPEKPYKYNYCTGCQYPCNGIFLAGKTPETSVTFILHLGCAALPEMIKHEAHSHPLTHVFEFAHNPYEGKISRGCNEEFHAHPYEGKICRGCNKEFRARSMLYGCITCDYYICRRCITMTSTLKHRWDPDHTLQLIYDPAMLDIDHAHEFNCEFCSNEIDTNAWFYHCSECDLSFHSYCTDLYLEYLPMKFGATNLKVDKLHHHELTFILNKKLHHRCKKCGDHLFAEPVLECPKCKIMFCEFCYS